MNKQEIEKRLNADEDRCKYCNYSTISAGDIYCNQGFTHDMDCEGKEFAVDFNIGVIISSNHITNGWIPCNERQPEKSDIYLVTFEEGKDRYVERFYYSSICGWMMPVVWQDEGRINEIIAWQPLPEAYHK